MLEQPYHQPADVARLLGVSAFTIRRWCEWHSAHLSPSANPSPGKPRRLDDRDVEVLRTVAQLRTTGHTTAEINAQLSTMTFAVVEASAENAPTIAQESPGKAIVLADVVTAVVTTTAPLEQRLAKLEAKQRIDVQSFALGVIVGLLFVLVFIGVAWAVGR